MNRIPKPQEIYKHFKGNLYQVITLAKHSETGEDLVIYQALYGDFQVYARPLASFLDKVDKVKYPNAAQENRFEICHKPECTGGVEAKEVILEVSEQLDAAEASPAPESSEPDIDPLVWEFLDAESHEARLNILAALHHRITDDMITTMAVACDIEVPEGQLEERYSQLKNCLQMLDRFEIRRN